MFANKLQIKRSINTCHKLGRLINNWEAWKHQPHCSSNPPDWFIDLLSTSRLGISRIINPAI